MLHLICGNCGQTFDRYPSNCRSTKSGRAFCSLKCKGEYQTREAIERVPVKDSSICVVCGQEKRASEFYRDKRCRANGGLQYACKVCVKAQRKIHYDANTEAINIRVRTYQEGKPGMHGKTPYIPEEAHARRLVNYAVKHGRITKPTACQECDKAGRLHAHHHHGYSDPLDVIWLCPSCHHAAHGRGPKARRLAERKGSPRIDWEMVYCMAKPATAEFDRG